MRYRDFTPDEIARFTMLEEPHPADFVLYKGCFNGIPVSVMVWVDLANNMLRPMAIILNDEHMGQLELQGTEIVQDEEG